MGNTFGRVFKVTSWGESHGPAVGCIVDGCPSNLPLSREDVQQQLDRRRPGQSDITTGRGEPDAVEILSGVFEEKTLGTPISMVIQNRDADSSKYEELRDTPRPGHADITWRMKYGHVDWRGGGRASARETVGRVAAGAVARKLIKVKGVEVFAFARSVGGAESSEEVDPTLKGIRDLIDSNPVRALDQEAAKAMEDEVLDAKREGDSVGGVIECIASGVPAGVGEPVFGKLDAELAKAVMSIPAIKGVEVGGGFSLAKMRGSRANDLFVVRDGEIKTQTNNAGGILGGISDSMPVVVRAAVKPTSSIEREQKTVNLSKLESEDIKVEGRHDPCIVPRAVPVVEAMVCLVLADQMMLAGLIPRKLG